MNQNVNAIIEHVECATDIRQEALPQLKAEIERILKQVRAETILEVSKFVRGGCGGWAGRDCRYEMAQAIADLAKQEQDK